MRCLCVDDHLCVGVTGGLYILPPLTCLQVYNTLPDVKHASLTSQKYFVAISRCQIFLYENSFHCSVACKSNISHALLKNPIVCIVRNHYQLNVQLSTQTMLVLSIPVLQVDCSLYFSALYKTNYFLIQVVVTMKPFHTTML